MCIKASYLEVVSCHNSILSNCPAVETEIVRICVFMLVFIKDSLDINTD